MHSPKLFVAVSLAGVLAACSKPQPHADAALARDLDLALSTGSGGVVSEAELGLKLIPKLRAPAAPSHARAVARLARSTAAVATEIAPEPVEVKTQATEETVAVAPEPEPAATQAAAPERQPAAEPQPTHTGHGGGSFPGTSDGGFRIPGIGGVVIIRGGGSGLDPCDEHHRGRGRGGIGGGILINTRAPSFPGRMSGGWGRF